MNDFVTFLNGIEFSAFARLSIRTVVVALAMVLAVALAFATSTLSFPFNIYISRTLKKEIKSLKSVDNCSLDTDLTVCVAGLPRSGSTLAYNIVRLLLMQYQPSLLYGWIGDRILNKNMGQYITGNQHNLTIVYKTHHLSEALVNSSDFFVFTHRNPIDQLCSLGLMFDSKILKNCSHAQEKCRWLVRLQEELYSKTSNKSVIELNYEEIITPSLQPQTVERILEKISLRKECISPTLYRTLGKLGSPKSGIFSPHHPFTLIHAGHQHEDRSRCLDLKACLLQDSVCNSWVARKGEIV